MGCSAAARWPRSSEAPGAAPRAWHRWRASGPHRAHHARSPQRRQSRSRTHPRPQPTGVPRPATCEHRRARVRGRRVRDRQCRKGVRQMGGSRRWPGQSGREGRGEERRPERSRQEAREQQRGCARQVTVTRGSTSACATSAARFKTTMAVEVIIRSAMTTVVAPRERLGEKTPDFGPGKHALGDHCSRHDQRRVHHHDRDKRPVAFRSAWRGRTMRAGSPRARAATMKGCWSVSIIEALRYRDNAAARRSASTAAGSTRWPIRSGRSPAPGVVRPDEGSHPRPIANTIWSSGPN